MDGLLDQQDGVVVRLLDQGFLSPPRGAGGVETRRAQQWLTSLSLLFWWLLGVL